MKRRILLGSFISGLFFCLQAKSQPFQLKYPDIKAAITSRTPIPLNADFTSAIASSSLIIIDIPDATAKSKIVLKDNTGITLAEGGVVGPIQATYDIKSIFTTPPSVNLKISLDGGANSVDIVFTDKKPAPVPTPTTSTTAGPLNEYEEAIKADYGLKLQSGLFKYDRKRNIQHHKNVIHIFIDEFGNTYFSGFPTTAREDNTYIIHLYYKDDDPQKSFKMETIGIYQPVQEIYSSEATSKASGNSGGVVVVIKEKQFATVGPYTSTAQFIITKLVKGVVVATPVNKTINIAKLHKIALKAGLYSSFLKNPENISMYVKPNGDTTLTADYPSTRSFVTVMLSFYPWPRNLLYPSDDPKERISISVGTSISKNLAENFFGMLNYDVAQGLSLSVGAHYGARNHIVGYPNFKYGEDKFSGNSLSSQIKKEYNVNWAIGLSIDFGLLSYIFKAPAQASGSGN